MYNTIVYTSTTKDTILYSFNTHYLGKVPLFLVGGGGDRVILVFFPPKKCWPLRFNKKTPDPPPLGD